MAHKKDIPHLIALLDDPSEEVRGRIETALLSFGPDLERMTAPFLVGLESGIRSRLDELYGEIRKIEFDKTWLKWLDIKDEETALEFAFSKLAYLAHGYTQPHLSDLLDELAVEFEQSGMGRTVPALNQFLFTQKGFRPPAEGYYDPQNSDLVSVIQEKKGIQISLSCISILVGHRVGLKIKGLNIPGHFMTCSSLPEGKLVIYDSFQQGMALSKDAMTQLSHSLKGQNKTLGEMKAQPFEIILRVLRNIINARFHHKGPRPGDLYKEIFDQLVQSLQSRGILPQ